MYYVSSFLRLACETFWGVGDHELLRMRSETSFIIAELFSLGERLHKLFQTLSAWQLKLVSKPSLTLCGRGRNSNRFA